MATRPLIHALSFDIEDCFHIVNVDGLEDRDQWATMPSIVESQTDWILQTLSNANVFATFFVLGWIAEQHPALVRKISGSGHEVASHSYWHRRVDLLSPESFREDLHRSLDVLRQQSGQPVRGFRAPSFSIIPGVEWAFDVLLDEGIEYDASLFPSKRAHGGYPCEPHPHVFRGAPSGRTIPELPMSVLHLPGLSVPFSGGGYLRLLPSRALRYAFDRFEREGESSVVYLHPRDFAPDCPKFRMPFYRRFKCYVGLKSTRPKLQMLLDRYRFDTCAAVLELEAPRGTTTRGEKH